MKHRILLTAGLLTALGFAFFTLTGFQWFKPKFNSIDLTGADYGHDFKLSDTEGHVRTLADFRGKAVLLFFGFTSCPEVCPTALARAVQVRKKLGDAGERLQVVLVTLDPARDTPDVLRTYVQAFDHSFIGLLGAQEEIKKTADEFRVFYRLAYTGGSYTVEHSAMSYVFDPKGRLRLAVRYDEKADEVAADIATLIKDDS